MRSETDRELAVGLDCPRKSGEAIAAPMLVAWGQRAARAGDRVVAYHLFVETLALDPTCDEAWLWRAGTSLDPREALLCLERALELNPGNAWARQGLADVRRELADVERPARQAEPEPVIRTRSRPAWRLLYVPAGLLLVTGSLSLILPLLQTSAPSVEVAGLVAAPSAISPRQNPAIELSLDRPGTLAASLDLAPSGTATNLAERLVVPEEVASYGAAPPAFVAELPDADESDPGSDVIELAEPENTAEDVQSTVAIATSPPRADEQPGALSVPARLAEQPVEEGPGLASRLFPAMAMPTLAIPVEAIDAEIRALEASPAPSGEGPPPEADDTRRTVDEAPPAQSRVAVRAPRRTALPTRTAVPTAEPTRTAVPTVEPTATRETSRRIAEPTPSPSAEPTRTPRATRTPEPTREPTREPTPEPKPEPTEAPALARSRLPTPAPPARAARKQPGWVWPARGPLTTYFGEVGPYSPRGHAGIDIAAPMGAPILAADDGVVVTATRDGGYGIYAAIDHGDGVRTLSAHMSQINVDVGERVQQGQVIGRIGSTGYSTGPHLHFEVRVNGGLRDPLGYLP